MKHGGPSRDGFTSVAYYRECVHYRADSGNRFAAMLGIVSISIRSEFVDFPVVVYLTGINAA